MVDRIVSVPDSLELPAAVKVPTSRLSTATAIGKDVLDAANAAAARTAIGAAGAVGQSFTAEAPAPTFGADLAPSIGSWTGAGGATYGGSSWNIPSGGTISTSIPVTSGTMYQIDLTRTGSSGGDMMVTLGTATIEIPSGGNNQLALTATTTGNVALTIGGGSWACATLSGVTVRPVTASPSPVASFAGQTLRASTYNIGLGSDSQRSLTTGSSNVAVGYTSQYSLTTGSFNVGMGFYTQYSLTAGSHNNAIGSYAQRSPRGVASWATTTASRQTSVGNESGQGSSTPSDDIVTVGYRAVADGNKAMALGSMASAAHAGSVALGADVTTTATGQVAIGARDLEVQDAAKGVVLRSPDGNRWRATINNTGVTTWTKL